MYEIHCDECNKKLNKNKDPYYSIEVTREMPKIKFYEVKMKGYDNKYEVNESWTTFQSIEFCDECWKKIEFERYLK